MFNVQCNIQNQESIITTWIVIHAYVLIQVFTNVIKQIHLIKISIPFHIVVSNFKLLHFCNLTTFLQNPITILFQLQISKAIR